MKKLSCLLCCVLLFNGCFSYYYWEKIRVGEKHDEDGSVTISYKYYIELDGQILFNPDVKLARFYVYSIWGVSGFLTYTLSAFALPFQYPFLPSTVIQKQADNTPKQKINTTSGG